MLVFQYEDIDQDKVTIGEELDVEEIFAAFDILKGKSTQLPTLKLFLKSDRDSYGSHSSSNSNTNIVNLNSNIGSNSFLRNSYSSNVNVLSSNEISVGIQTPPLRTPPTEDLLNYTNPNSANDGIVVGGLNHHVNNEDHQHQHSHLPTHLQHNKRSFLMKQEEKARSNSFTPPLRTPPPSPPSSRKGKYINTY